MKVELSHSLEDVVGLFCMGLWVRRGHEEVIHIDDGPSLSDHVSKRVIHESLEYGRGVEKTEEHDGRFKESFVSDEGGLPLVAVFDLNIVVPPMNVELGEVASVFQLVHKVEDERKGVGVIGGMFIEVMIVLAGAELAILLFDEEEGGYLGRVERMDLSSGKVFFEKIFGGLLFIWGERVDFAYLWHEGFIEIDLVIIGSGGGNVVGCFLREDLCEVSIL